MSNKSTYTDGIDPTSLVVLLRQAETPMPYRLVDRWRDRCNGRRDGQIGMAGPDVLRDRTLSVNATPYLRMLNADRDGRCATERQTFEALALKLKAQAQVAEDAREDAVIAVEEAEGTLAGLPTAVPEDVLSNKRGTETVDGTPDVVTRRRRAREYEKTVTGPVRQQLARARQQADDAAAQARALKATIDRLHVVLDERLTKLTDFYARRTRAYEMAYLRRSGVASGSRPSVQFTTT